MITQIEGKWYHYHNEPMDNNYFVHECEKAIRPIVLPKPNPQTTIASPGMIVPYAPVPEVGRSLNFSRCSWRLEKIHCDTCGAAAPDKVNDFAAILECEEIHEAHNVARENEDLKRQIDVLKSNLEAEKSYHKAMQSAEDIGKRGEAASALNKVGTYITNNSNWFFSPKAKEVAIDESAFSDALSEAIRTGTNPKPPK
jgi:hypothetical protein